MRRILMKTSRSSKGTSLLGAIVTILVLAAMGSTMAAMVATNQEVRAHQYTADQAFASTQAGLEVALGLIHNNVSPCASISRNLMGDSSAANSVVVSRTNNKIYVTGSKSDSSTAMSIVDPSPPVQGGMLEVNTTAALDPSNGAPPKKLVGVTFQLGGGCGSTTITSMTNSWTDASHDDCEDEHGEHHGHDDDHHGHDDECGEGGAERVDQIRLDGVNLYTAATNHGKLSGETADTDDVTISDAGTHTLDFIRWDSDIQDRLYTIKLNFSDGSHKTFTVDTR